LRLPIDVCIWLWNEYVGRSSTGRQIDCHIARAIDPRPWKHFIADGGRPRGGPFQIGGAGSNGIAEDAESRIAGEVAALVGESAAVGAADRVDGTIGRFHQRLARHSFANAEFAAPLAVVPAAAYDPLGTGHILADADFRMQVTASRRRLSHFPPCPVAAVASIRRARRAFHLLAFPFFFGDVAVGRSGRLVQRLIVRPVGRSPRIGRFPSLQNADAQCVVLADDVDNLIRRLLRPLAAVRETFATSELTGRSRCVSFTVGAAGAVQVAAFGRFNGRAVQYFHRFHFCAVFGVVGECVAGKTFATEITRSIQTDLTTAPIALAALVDINTFILFFENESRTAGTNERTGNVVTRMLAASVIPGAFVNIET